MANGDIVWLDELPATDSLLLFEAVWKLSGTRPTGNWSITLDTTEFFDKASGRKLGLGSSAALASALAAALGAVTGSSHDSNTLAADAHRNFQQGKGSGIDIATATQGGLIRYQLDAPTNSLQWPSGLAWRLLWSGVAVSTPNKLRQLENHSPQASRERLSVLAGDVADVWQAGDCRALLAALRRYVEVLQRFSIDHELGIFEAGHQELVARADHYSHTVYKPCGAGGGDIGIVLAESQHDVERFVAEAAGAGFLPLDVEFDPDGVRAKENVPC
jgi:phosphomevalonate kinase